MGYYLQSCGGSVMKKILAAAVLTAVMFSLFSGCTGNANQITPEDLKERGEIIVGVKNDVPYFSYFDSAKGGYSGYEIEIAAMIAEEMLGSRDKVTYVPVTTRTRTVSLDHSEVDFVIATFTINEERLAKYNFSNSYYEDFCGFLVRTDSDIRDIGDLDGKNIGVLQGSSSGRAVKDAAKAAGVDINVITYASYPDIQAALLTGRCSAFCSDRAVLKGYLTNDLTLTPDMFAPQDYAIATRKNDTELAEYINELIIKWENDGTLTALKEKYGI
jgi:putative glutamine transport system substrate-binding protein